MCRRCCAEVQSEHPNREEGELRWPWTWRVSCCQTGWSEYFTNYRSTGNFTYRTIVRVNRKRSEKERKRRKKHSELQLRVTVTCRCQRFECGRSGSSWQVIATQFCKTPPSATCSSLEQAAEAKIHTDSPKLDHRRFSGLMSHKPFPRWWLVGATLVMIWGGGCPHSVCF